MFVLFDNNSILNFFISTYDILASIDWLIDWLIDRIDWLSVYMNFFIFIYQVFACFIWLLFLWNWLIYISFFYFYMLSFWLFHNHIPCSTPFLYSMSILLQKLQFTSKFIFYFETFIIFELNPIVHGGSEVALKHGGV